MDNLKLLEYSIKHPEPLMDKNYMFLNKHVDLQKYVKKTQNIKNILIAIKEMKSANISGKTIDKMYLKLDKELNNYSVFSEFSCFINACDLNNGEVRGKIDLLKKVTDYYLKHRDLNDIVPAEWIQALIDKTTSRKKGQAGEKKLLQLLKTKRYNFVDTLEDFMSHNKSCARFSKKGGLSNKNLKRELGVTIGKKNQDKKLDLLIKNNKNIYFLEAKHISTGGGGQNKQISELIDIIRLKTNNKNYHFISFLDGVHFNTLFKKHKKTKKSDKILIQQKDIKKALKVNKTNYFINTAGFKKLFR